MKKQDCKIPNTPENRYIFPTRSGKFQIRKHIDGKQRYYGTYESLEDARRKRDELVLHDWDTGVVVVNVGRRVPRGPDVHIHRQSNGRGFVIQYRGRYFGQYDSIGEARVMRDRFVECGWDTSVVCVPYRTRPHGSVDRYLVREGRGWSIQKWCRVGTGRELVRYDTGIPTVEEARRLRDWWVEHDWDWSEIDGM